MATESRLETEILNDYKESPHFRIKNSSDQIIYVIAVEDYPWLTMAVGDIKNDKLINVFYLPFGFWALILGMFLILLLAYKYFYNSLLGMFLVQNNKFYNKQNRI